MTREDTCWYRRRSGTLLQVCLYLMCLFVFTARIGNCDVVRTTDDVSESSTSSSDGSSSVFSTSLCPGVTIDDCSDVGCFGLDASSCPSTCFYNSAVQQCVGVRSCVANACSGHGRCHPVNNSAAVCECDVDYYGADCSTHCNELVCEVQHGIAELMCTAEGVCACPGHFTSLATECSFCEDGYYGVSCDDVCPCNGHGSCDRISGLCNCYADDRRGYWSDDSCSTCLLPYMGDSCTARNALLTVLSEAELVVLFDNVEDDGAGANVVVAWVGSTYLLVANGAVAVLGKVDATVQYDEERAKFTAMGDPYTASGAVRDIVTLRNGTLAMLTVGLRGAGNSASSVSSSSSSSSSSLPSNEVDSSYSNRESSALEATVVHCTVDAQSGDGSFTPVDAAVFPAVSATPKASSASAFAALSDAAGLTSARISEDWGWAVLQASNIMTLSHRLTETLTLPADFTATSLHIDDASGLVFVLGARNGEAAVYATHTMSTSSSLVQVTLTDATTGDMLRVAGAAWKMNATGSTVYVAGASDRAAWLLAGTLAVAATDAPTRVAIGVGAMSTAPLSGGPLRSMSMVTQFTHDIDSVLCVAHADTSITAAAWTSAAVPAASSSRSSSGGGNGDDNENDSSSNSYNSVEVGRKLVLRTLQDITTDVDFVLTTSLHAAFVPSSGLLLLSQARVYSTDSETTATAIVIDPFTTYAVTSILPSAFDLAGEATLTITGMFFVPDMNCVFDSWQWPATVLNSTTLQCRAPSPSIPFSCVPMAIELTSTASVFPAVTANSRAIRRLHGAAIDAAVGANTSGPYTSINSTLPITLYGQGFTNLSTLLCLYYDFVNEIKTPALYISAHEVQCDLARHMRRPTIGPYGSLTVSLDGVVFSTSTLFAFIGAAARLAVVEPSREVVVTSAAFVELPPITLSVVDSEGHELRELDVNVSAGGAAERVVHIGSPWFNSTRKGTPDAIDPTSSLVVLAYSNKTVNGTTSFSVYLQYPLVGVGMLTFSAPGLEPATLIYRVEEGEPYTIAVAVQPSPVLSSHYNNSGRQPVALFKDVAGNIVGSQDALLRHTVGFMNVTYFNGTAWETRRSKLANDVGYFNFSGIYPHGFFGKSYTMTFSADGFRNASSAVMTTGNCYKDQFGQYGTMDCLACPPHAICNGTYAFNVTDGFWKGGDFAYDVYACPRPRVCHGGACATGYTGVLCGQCAGGYGMTGTECVQCFSVAANVVLVVLLVLFVLLVPLLLILLTFQIFGPFFSVVHGAYAVFGFLQLLGLAVLPMPELPDYVERFLVFTRLLSSGDVLKLSPFDCLFGSIDATTKFAIELIAVWIVLLVLFIILMYGDVVVARHQEALRKKKWFLKLLAPFPSEEAYHQRLAELGLDEERAVGGAMAAATTTTSETLNPKQRRIREAYALLDSNRYALSAVSQLPNSAVRESAVASLLAEQEELTLFLREYEAYVSSGGAPPVRARVTRRSRPLFRVSAPNTRRTVRVQDITEVDGGEEGREEQHGEGEDDASRRHHARLLEAEGGTRAAGGREDAIAVAAMAVGASDAGGVGSSSGGSGEGPATAAAAATAVEHKAQDSDPLATTVAGHNGCAADRHAATTPGEGGGKDEEGGRLDGESSGVGSCRAASASLQEEYDSANDDNRHHPTEMTKRTAESKRSTRGNTIKAAAAAAAADDAGGDGGARAGSEERRGGGTSNNNTAAKTAMQRFSGVTATPFTLFGTHEPFRPIPAELHYLHPQLLPATEQVAPQRPSIHASASFLWPHFRAQLIILCFVAYEYFYVAILQYSFALARCESTTLVTTNVAADGSVASTTTVHYSSLVADRRVDCNARKYGNYRIAGIVLGTAYGAALPLLILGLTVWTPRSTAAANGGRPQGVQYLRECLIAILGLSEPFFWWEAVVLLYKFALVLIRNLIPSNNIAGLVVVYLAMAVCAFLVYFQPYYGFVPQALQVVGHLMLTVTVGMQLLPLVYSSTMDNGVTNIPVTLTPVQRAGGVIVVALPCLTLALMLFAVWAVNFSRRRWTRLTKVLFTVGGGFEVHNILHFLHREKTGKDISARWSVATPALRFSFAGYNMHLVQQAMRRSAAAAKSDDAAEEATLEEQVVQAVRGKSLGKARRDGTASSLWANWGMVGGLIGMSNHVHLLSRFIKENEGAVPGDAAEKESSTRADAAHEPVLPPMTVMDREAGDELVTMCEHLRQLEHFVLQMEKALDRRTEN